MPVHYLQSGQFISEKYSPSRRRPPSPAVVRRPSPVATNNARPSKSGLNTDGTSALDMTVLVGIRLKVICYQSCLQQVLVLHRMTTMSTRAEHDVCAPAVGWCCGEEGGGMPSLAQAPSHAGPSDDFFSFIRIFFTLF